MRYLKILGVAVGSGQCAFTLLLRDSLLDWGTSDEAVKTSSNFAEFLQTQINTLKPDVVVTERIGKDCRKGRWQQKLIRSAAELASHNHVLDVSISRPKVYENKFEEAQALARRYPEVAGYAPKRKRRLFDNTPRGLILFEALIMAEQVMYGAPKDVAKRMG